MGYYISKKILFILVWMEAVDSVTVLLKANKQYSHKGISGIGGGFPSYVIAILDDLPQFA